MILHHFHKNRLACFFISGVDVKSCTLQDTEPAFQFRKCGPRFRVHFRIEELKVTIIRTQAAIELVIEKLAVIV